MKFAGVLSLADVVPACFPKTSDDGTDYLGPSISLAIIPFHSIAINHGANLTSADIGLFLAKGVRASSD